MRHALSAITVLLCLTWSASALGSDDTLRVFPTYAVAGTQNVTVPVHVWLFEREYGLLRNAAVTPLEAILDIEEGSPEQLIFEQRAVDFMVDNDGGEEVFVTLRGPGIEPVERRLGETPSNGHLQAEITVPFAPIPGAVKYRFELEVRVEDGPTTVVQVPLLEPSGISVVTDIDDTIKVTNVLDTQEMLANSFTREFRQVPGMSAFLGRLGQKYRPNFHYLSASPWNLYTGLDAWRRRDGFPDAVWHLRIFRAFEIGRTARFLRGSEGHKVKQLELLFKRFPARTFILVGDSGEADPEIYGRVTRNFPASVEHIYIREVPGAKNGADRFAAAFDGLPDASWTTFDDPSSLPN